MNPHSSAGPWAHPPRTFNGVGRTENAMAQPDVPSLPTRHVVDLTADGPEPSDREPPPKRPRLEVPGSNAPDNGPPTGDARNTPGSASSRPAISWRGRPLWSFQAVISEIPGNGNRGDNGTGSKPPSPPPLPAQPWKTPAVAESPGLELLKSRESSPVGDVETTPYRIETPAIAPVFKGNKPADFTPWTGSHPEDVLNEQTAKQGYYDRTQVSQNESNTARPALYTQFKHRTGLQMLSSVFAAALEKRQNHSTIHAPSTFKPPPRVTLTDNKREAWLRDLANPSVPLRRLSRTIPHGIRGKVLLDQCLGKWIPVARAVWLGKCVGANEIRAFKRKGTSGAMAVGLEAKWVRDWTTNVQQFMEGVFGAPKSSDWKAKMTYAVGLTARLFFENLLDHDHFLEWFLLSFEAASISTIPIWLLMLGTYWNSIMRYRRRGRRLAELLLQKLRLATEANLTQLQPLIDRLSRFVRKVVRDHTSSMILPNSWETYIQQVSSSLDLTNEADKDLFQNISERNARIQRPKHSTKAARRSPHQRIIGVLDSICPGHEFSSILAVFDAFDDKAALVCKLLEWLSTPFRYGHHRVYIAARLLRKWKSTGIDIDSHILTFLSQRRSQQKLETEPIYHVISELVRSQTFSVGRYLQWLMARGVTNTSPSQELKVEDLPMEIGLIAQLPIGRLPEHVGNLRNTLLARTGLCASREISVVRNVQNFISRSLPDIFGLHEPATVELESLPSNLSWAVKAEVGQWLRRAVAEYNRDPTELTTRAFTNDTALPPSTLAPAQFYIIREILETFRDISMLADVLKYASSCRDSTVLASVADTINCHFDSLCVIGATGDLFRRLIDAYAGIKRLATPTLDLIFSLVELGMRIPNELNSVSIIRQDLSRMESKSIVAASSPVSDHIPDNFVDIDPLFREKLDQLLLSGNVMDEPTLDTVFNALMKPLESDDSKASLSANDTCRYLAQLRSFSPKYFDSILARWVCSHLKSSDRATLWRILPPLIGVGCVTIRAFLALAKRLTVSAPTAIPNAAHLPVELVQHLISNHEATVSLDLVSYRFRLAQQEFLIKNLEEVLAIVCNAASCVANDPVAASSDMESFMVRLLRDLLVRNPGYAAQNGMQNLVGQYPAAVGLIQKALDLLLGVESQSDRKLLLSEVEKLAGMTDDFSLPFCQLKLQILFGADSAAAEDRAQIVDAMFKTAVSDSRAHRAHWVNLVGLMSPDAVRQIRERAEREFLSIPLLEEAMTDVSGSYESDSLQNGRLYLTIIEELASSIPDAGVPTLAAALAEKMDSLFQKVLSIHNNSLASSTGANNQLLPTFKRPLAFWFSAILRMIVLHRSAFAQSPAALRPNLSHDQVRLLAPIFCISLSRFPGDLLRQLPVVDYQHPAAIEGSRSRPGVLLQTHALDVAASLIDMFPDEVRHQCARFLKEKCYLFVPAQNDSRLPYLLGPIADQYSTNAQQLSSPSPSGLATTPNPTPVPVSLIGPSPAQQSVAAASGLPTGSDGSNDISNRLRLQHRGRILGPYPVRPWELLEDAAPFLSINDTAVNLGYFNARRVRV